MSKKLAIVTGGVRRLGASISLQLLADGYRVAAFHTGPVPEEFKLYTRDLDFLSVPCDLSVCSPEHLHEKIDQTERHFGCPVSLLVNNAAIIFETPFLATTQQDWESLFDINLKSVFFLSQAVAKSMIRNSMPGNIIMISDTAGGLTWPKYLVYSLTKTSISQLTRLLAKELAPGIRVNAIAPGTIIPFEGADETWIEQAKDRSVLKEIGSPEEIAKLISVIVETRFMTGSILTVDGGRALL